MGSGTLKPGWTPVAFGDVVRLCTERASDPAAHGLERYVGLEHLHPGDLEIRRWGDVADGTTFTTVFRPGQVLFGKRRAYQRKVAVPDFTGVCSGDIYVLESSNDQRLLPELLPFVCQTESFFDHAISTSAGSLSPRTNWRSLAGYEFALPPLDEQNRLAIVLRAGGRTASLYVDAAAATLRIAESLLGKYLVGARDSSIGLYHRQFGHYSPQSALVQLGDLVTVAQYGSSVPIVSEGQYPILRMTNLSEGLTTDADIGFVNLTDQEYGRYLLRSDDILLNRTNSHDLVGRTGIHRLKGDYVFASYLIRFQADHRKVLPDYLCAFINHPLGRRQVMRFATRGVSQSNINIDSLRRMLVPLPGLTCQRAIVRELDTLRETRVALRQRARKASQFASRFLSAQLRRT